MMRPDERAGKAEIERDKEFRSNVGKGIKTAAVTASTALGARIMPFLSEYVPTDLAMKGLQKVSPRAAEFLKRGRDAGLDVREGMDYLKNVIKPKQEEQPQEKTKEDRNIIEQYSPELHQFIEQQVASGRDPIQAGALAQMDKRFSSVIKKLSQDHKTPWSSIIEAVYGAGERPGAMQQSGNSGQLGQEQQQPPGQDQQNDKWQAFKEEFKQFMNS